MTDRLPQTYSPKHTEHFQVQNGEELFLSGGGRTNKIKKLQCSQHECDSCLLMSNFYLECITKYTKLKFSLPFQDTTEEMLFCKIQQENYLQKQIFSCKCNSFYHSCTIILLLFLNCIRETIYKDCYLPIDAIFPRV